MHVLYFILQVNFVHYETKLFIIIRVSLKWSNNIAIKNVLTKIGLK